MSPNNPTIYIPTVPASKRFMLKRQKEKQKIILN